MRRLPSRLLWLAMALIAAGVGLAAPAGAGAAPQSTEFIRVVQAEGLIDPILSDFLEDSVARADEDGALVLVIQLDSGGVVDDEGFDRLLEVVSGADVPVAVWVGPSGALAGGRAAELVEAADHRALAPGSRIEIDGVRLNATEAFARGVTTVGARCDREQGSDEGCAATIGDLIVSLPEVPTREFESGCEPGQAPGDGDCQVRQEPLVQTRFAQLSLVDRLLHTVASPPVAYLLFVIGMALLVFELYTAGVGVAGVVGAAAFLLGCYGLAVLPARPLGVALLVFAMFGYAVDVQTGVPRVWTGIATVSFVAGSLVLYEDGIALSWITLVAGIVGMTLAMLAGMPAMVRTRFSTPTIGREWMIGEEGTARTAVDPDGTVIVRDAPWRARTNRATPIAAGEAVRVAAIEGLVLEVEPGHGGARDYRDRPADSGRSR